MQKMRMMNACDVSELDTDALLPPRKRLLAGLKRQISDANFQIPSTSSGAWNEFDDRLNHHLKSQVSNPNMSSIGIFEASRRAAAEAAKNAEAARARAEEKAAKAAKLVAAAKSALDLVATLSEEASKRKNRLRRNKSKKNIHVESLYNKNKRRINCREDEELARTLHRSINSSPRISKNFSSSDLKNKHKRLKSSASFKKTSMYSGGLIGEGNKPSMPTSNGNGTVEKVQIEGPVTVDLNASDSENVGQLSLNHGEEVLSGKTNGTKMKNEGVDAVRIVDSSDSLSKKRGRVKQKKLPLSICTFKDQTVPKEHHKFKDTLQPEGNDGRAAKSNQPLFPENSPKWKCQAFKAPKSIEQNKVMQS